MLEAAAAYLSLLIILICLPTLHKTPVNAVKLEIFVKEENNITAVVVACAKLTIFCPVLLKSKLNISIFSFNVSEDWDNLIIWESASPKAFPAAKLCSLNSFIFSVSLTKFWALSSRLLPASEILVEAFFDATLKSDIFRI